MELEKLYLVCVECGEAFDDLRIARDHELNTYKCIEADYKVKTESEAM